MCLLSHRAYLLWKENVMNSIIYWVGFIVILLAVLSFVGVR